MERVAEMGGGWRVAGGGRKDREEQAKAPASFPATRHPLLVSEEVVERVALIAALPEVAVIAATSAIDRAEEGRNLCGGE